MWRSRSLAVVVLPAVTLSFPNARINLPTREYRLAPGRRTETITFLRGQMANFWHFRRKGGA